MKWTEEKDEIYVKEILLFEPWNHKHGSEERGNCWERISESLNGLQDISFRVNQRSVRDRYNKLEKMYKKKVSDDLKASGINPPEETEVEKAVHDI